MKKTILILAVFIGLMSQAQFKFVPAAKVGLNASNFEGLDADYRKSFYVSFLCEFRFNETYSLLKELSYSNQGADNVNFSNYNGVNHSDVKYPYLSEIIAFKISTKQKFNFQGGVFLLIF
jgi:hypothetical protein